MRWSTIRLIWFRELRDQVRDRRTLFTVLLLPLLLYPLLGFLVMQFAVQLLDQTSTIGFVVADPEAETFPEPLPPEVANSPWPALSWLTLTPPGPGTPLHQLGGAAALERAGHLSLDYVPLIDSGQIPELYSVERKERLPIFAGSINFEYVFLTPDEADAALTNNKVDLLVWAPEGFLEELSGGGRPQLTIKGRRGDDRSRRAAEQFSILLGRWKAHLKEVRFARLALPLQFGDPFAVSNSLAHASEEVAAAETLLEMLVRTFPFMLVMWSLAGALYPAVDVCAGEKERGTMETLLISPAGREEIVYGKFLTIWVFSAVTASMHLLSMSLATWQLRAYLPPEAAVSPAAFFWCVLLVLPLSAFFSAVSLAIGAYARSSKEGQYYLMPLFWLTMPLVMLTMVPGVALNQFYSMVPVTGVALLMQELMLRPSPAPATWFYFLPVFATVILYSWLSLRWAIKQFQREEVLFREAERLDLLLWLRRLFREKEPLPTAGQALFCFLVLLSLRWLSLDLGAGLHLLARAIVVQIAFVAMPPLIMVLMLTTRPRLSLNVTLPRAGYVAAAFLLLPLAELAHYLMQRSPQMFQLLMDRRSFVEAAYREIGTGSVQNIFVHNFLVLSLLPAICKELAFRGFILSGLRRGLATWPAILLSSFLFAAYHMNVFALIPLFLLGVALSWFAVRSGSLLPGIILHTGCNMLLLGGPLVAMMAQMTTQHVPDNMFLLLAPPALVCAVLALVLLWRLNAKPRQEMGKIPVPHATDST